MDAQTNHVCKFAGPTSTLSYDLLTIAVKWASLNFDTCLVFLVECQRQYFGRYHG